MKASMENPDCLACKQPGSLESYREDVKRTDVGKQRKTGSPESFPMGSRGTHRNGTQKTPTTWCSSSRGFYKWYRVIITHRNGKARKENAGPPRWAMKWNFVPHVARSS